jgi:hypothetical protein
MVQIDYLALGGVFLFCVFLFYWLLDNVSDLISLIGLYHDLDSSDLINDTAIVFGVRIPGVTRSPNCTGYSINMIKGVLFILFLKENRDEEKTNERLFEKIAKIGRVYVFLSILLVACFYVILTNQIFIFKIDSSSAFLLSITVSLATLLIVRLLANPNQEPKISNHYLDPEIKDGTLEVHKERILSFLYGFIATNVFLTVVIMGYGIYNYNSVIQQITSQDSMGAIFSFLSNFSFMYFVYWIVLLFFCSVFGEVILISINPKHKADRVPHII